MSSDLEETKLLKRIEENTSLGMAKLADIKQTADTEPPLVAAQYFLSKKRILHRLMTGIMADLNEFHDREMKKVESTSPAVMKLQRERIKYLLLAGIIFNIISAVMLALYFVRSITSRLAIVLENADRLRQRRTLRAPLTGDDEIALLDSAFHDMSQSLRGEENLILASQDQLRAIVDQMPIGLVIITESDKEDLIEYANPTLEKLLVYESGALAGSPLSRHFSALGAKNAAAPVHDTSTMEGLVPLVAYKKDRSELAVEFSVSDASLGNLYRRLATIIDVSEKQALEKIKQAFVAMISHELRTPLTSVSGFLQILPMGAYGQIPPPAVSAAAVAETHVDQLIALINDLLDLEKLEAGKLELIKTTVVLEDVLDAAAGAVCDLAQTVNAQVIFEGCQAQIAGDPSRLEQALTKVLTFIMNLCPSGETINIGVSATGGKAVTVTFSTKLLKLTADQLSTIFEPFQQFELSSARGSMGLALPLVRAIILAHGGTCGADLGAAGGIAIGLQIPNLS